MISRFFRVFLLCTFVFILTDICSAQKNDDFINYLSKNKLQREHVAYLEKVKTSDSIGEPYNYYLAKYYLQYPNDSLLLSSIKKSALFIEDSCGMFSTSLHFLSNPSLFTNDWFTFSIKNELGRSNSMLNKIYSAGQSPSKFQPGEFVEPLRLSFTKLKKFDKKKPFVAGLLSTLIPGLGKLYNGQSSSFFTTFLTHAVLGLQIYESLKIREIKSGIAIFNIGFTGLMYFGNIYGSYKNVKKKKKELRNQFYINAASYYTNYNFCEN